MIGRGGMGEVWRARHKMLARDAAIKLIRPEMLAGVSGRQEQIARRRFELEAQATASLRSPHTVALFDFGQTKDRAFYYVMELLDGVDLQTLVERYGPLAESRVVKILLEACESLEEAHRHGLVHRDIKPKNILLCRLGLQYDFVKVLDFGLVKSLQGSDVSLMTLDGTATGTPAYLSPEVAMGEAKIDGRADLYSLGCVAYFLLTGQMVFTETNPTALALAHVQKRPAPLRERTELKISEGLEAIVLRLLEKDPANRPRSAQELSRQLGALTDIPRWSKEQAMEWWQTNLPETAATAVAESSSDKLEPVGAQLKG
jgi:serine/threonine-protein kinase